MKPFLSVVIPCRNEVRFLGRCLDSVLGGDYPAGRMEVLVADGRSEDGTRELIAVYAARDPRVRLIDNPQGTTPWGLNHALEAAAGDVIARVDAHSCVSESYFTRCVECLYMYEADCVGGAMRTLPQDEGCFAGPIVAALTHRFGVGNSHFRIGTGQPRWVDTVFNACWRRRVFEKLGGFNTDLPRSQDMEFSLRLKNAGGKILLAPRAWTDYYARSRFGPFCRHNFLNGQWAVLPFLYSDVVPVSLRHLVPLLFVAALLTGLALTPWTRVPLWVCLVPYLIANAAASADCCFKHRKLRYLGAIPFMFFSLHLSYGLGGLAGAWRAQRVLFSGARPRAPRRIHAEYNPD
jgi:succinoglycan biosynthesis protein ExoA